MKTNYLIASLALPFVAGAFILAGCGGGSSGTVPGPNPTPTTQPPVAQNVILIDDAFTSNPNGEIYTIRPDGKGRVNLSNNPANDMTPTYSPDGRTIAFSSNRNGGLYKLYLMGSDGSNVRQITMGAGNDRFPSYSPDGTKIVFASDRDAALALNTRLEQPSASVLAARSRMALRLRGKSASLPLIASPSGKPEDLYLLTLASGAIQRLTTNPAGDTSPDFSPDGNRIVFESDRGTDRDEDIYLMNANGQNQVPVTSDGSLEKNPRWSPDGRRIAFSASPTEGTGRREGLYTINPDGTQPFQVDAGNAFRHTYSPEGQRLATGTPLFIIGVNGTTIVVPVNERGEQLADFADDWR